MARKRHVRFNAFLGLSPAGKSVVYQGIDEDWTQKKIQQRLEEATSEKIANGSLSRFVIHYRTKRDQERSAQLHVNRLIAAVEEGKVDAIETTRAFLNQAMVELIDAGDAQLDAETVMRLTRMFEDLQLEKGNLAVKQDKLDVVREQLELAKRQAKIVERRLEEKERQLEAVRNKAKQAQEKLTRRKDLPADVKRDIRSIYGLASGESDAA